MISLREPWTIQTKDGRLVAVDADGKMFTVYITDCSLHATPNGTDGTVSMTSSIGMYFTEVQPMTPGKAGHAGIS